MSIPDSNTLVLNTTELNFRDCSGVVKATIEYQGVSSAKGTVDVAQVNLIAITDTTTTHGFIVTSELLTVFGVGFWSPHEGDYNISLSCSVEIIPSGNTISSSLDNVHSYSTTPIVITGDDRMLVNSSMLFCPGDMQNQSALVSVDIISYTGYNYTTQCDPSLSGGSVAYVAQIVDRLPEIEVSANSEYDMNDCDDITIYVRGMRSVNSHRFVYNITCLNNIGLNITVAKCDGSPFNGFPSILTPSETSNAESSHVLQSLDFSYCQGLIYATLRYDEELTGATMLFEEPTVVGVKAACT